MAEGDEKGPEDRTDALLGGLPASRPGRRSARRDAPAAKPAAAKPKPKAAAAKPKPATAKAKPKPAAAKPKPKPTAAKPKAKPSPKPALAAAPEPRRPQAVKAGSPKLDGKAPTRERDVPDDAGVPAPSPQREDSGTELVEVAVKAAGQVVQLGVSVTGELVKRAARKLPGR